MGLKGIAPIQVRTHAGYDAHTAFAGGGDTFAEEVTAIKKLSVPVELNFGRVEGEDPGYADENDIRAGRVPIVCPFFNIHHDRIVLGHVALSDAANLLLPGQSRWIDGRQPGWQRNEFRGPAADGCMRDRFR